MAKLPSHWRFRHFTRSDKGTCFSSPDAFVDEVIHVGLLPEKSIARPLRIEQIIITDGRSMEVIRRAAIVGTHSPACSNKQGRTFRSGIMAALSWAEGALEIDSGGVGEIVAFSVEPDLRCVVRPHPRHYGIRHCAVTRELAPVHPTAVFPVIAVITPNGPWCGD
jgi:hypothetical protein